MTTRDDLLYGKRILLIDDDDTVLGVIARAFSLVGCTVYTAPNGQVGLWQFFEHEPDLVILDVIMPIMDGWETCRRLRQISTVPILMLTCVEGDPQVIRGLGHGADDYLVKPVGLELLLARAQALLRRTALPPPSPKSFSYDDGYLKIDRRERQVWLQGQSIELTETEYDLLAYLCYYGDQWRTHEQILHEVWGKREVYTVDVVYKNMRRLRRKVEIDPQRPRYLLSKYGLGYRFKKQNPG